MREICQNDLGERTSQFFSWQTALAATAVGLDDKALASDVYPQLVAYRGMVEPGFWGFHCVVDPMLARLSALVGDRSTTTRHFEEALEFCRDRGFRPELARTCVLYAEHLLSDPPSTDPATVGILLDEGQVEASQLGMIRVVDQINAVRDRLTTLTRDAAFRPAGLTRAELDVLRLLVDGRTNAEIASLLFVTINTVNSHVSGILRKTGSTSRAQAIRFAHKTGLT